ncbi:LOW QUALITY PROTEIN: hypothetical protein NC651_029469 [Populus alba x Populus x berolinensis]|nr:LOW QUALITY PROTEIN: hypothetical protein NC651_029469 [Populus alba x Populus x berolinensis]
MMLFITMGGGKVSTKEAELSLLRRNLERSGVFNGEWKPPLEGEEEEEVRKRRILERKKKLSGEDENEVTKRGEKEGKRVPNTTLVKPVESLKQGEVGKDKYLVEYQKLENKRRLIVVNTMQHKASDHPQIVVVDHFKMLGKEVRCSVTIDAWRL